MRLLCHLLVGVPLFGFCGGALLFLVQTIHGFRDGPQPWAECLRFFGWLFRKWSIWSEASRFVSFYCDLCLGAHIAAVSLLLGLFCVPLGLRLARRLK
jgi:hypothetical protein